MTVHDDPSPRRLRPLPRQAEAPGFARGVPVGDRLTVTVWAADPLSRAGVVHLLAGDPGFAQTQAGEGIRPFVEAAVTVLVTGRLDDASAVEVRRRVRQGDGEVVLVAEPLREPELMIALECGVRTILRRDEVSRDELAAAVRVAPRHESRLPADLLGRLMTRIGQVHRSAAHAYPAGPLATGLDAREIEVLGLLAGGLETKDIAAKLAYSERTIKNVIYGLTSRLQLRNRTHAVAYAFREGYL